MEDLITVNEAADLLGIKVASLRIYLSKDKNIPRVHQRVKTISGERKRVFLSRNWCVERQNSGNTRRVSTRKANSDNVLQP